MEPVSTSSRPPPFLGAGRKRGRNPTTRADRSVKFFLI